MSTAGFFSTLTQGENLLKTGCCVCWRCSVHFWLADDETKVMHSYYLQTFMIKHRIMRQERETITADFLTW